MTNASAPLLLLLPSSSFSSALLIGKSQLKWSQCQEGGQIEVQVECQNDMSDRMPERMPDRMSEYMSERKSVGGGHSKKLILNIV